MEVSMQTSRVILSLMSIIFILTGCGGGGDSTNGNTESQIPDTTISTTTEYKLVWQDEFNESTLDIQTWSIENGYGPDNDGWGNDESQLYTDSTDNLKVEDGNLVITARCDSGVCGKRDGSITSAKINTKDKYEFQFGKVEARIKVPSGTGTWPAFWMLGSNFPDTAWPASGEIDIMEIFQGVGSNINTTHSTIHYSKDDTHTYTGDSKELDSPLSNDFHIWSMEWDESSIIFKIDGVKYYTALIDETHMAEFLKSFYFILNIAIDGTLGGTPNEIKTTPQSMYVDYIRVYQKVGITGTVVDGYISGAKACLDLNVNGTCDENEPTTLTKEDGTFSFYAFELEEGKLIPVIVTGGIDTATNKPFEGELKNVVSTDQINDSEDLIVSPLTDLLATSFLESDTKDDNALASAKETISKALDISEEELNLNPMENKKVFVKAQQIQQIKALIKTTLEKNSDGKLSDENENSITKALVEQLSEDKNLDIKKAIEKVEQELNISIPK